MTEGLKDIIFRGGLVCFKIPAHWKEEYTEHGGGAFYDNIPDSGTLRLNVFTMQAPPDARGELPILALLAVPDINSGDIEKLVNGNAIVRAVQRSKDQGVDIILYWWYIARQIGLDTVRIANFSHTILSAKEKDPLTISEIKLLDLQIRQAVLDQDEEGADDA